MPFEFRAEYKFHPVGQGLFSSGCLYWKEDRFRFRWVYDCGTLHNQELVDQALKRFVSNLTIEDSAKPKLGLVAISHFDRDHISGMASLLSRCYVHTVLLPFMPLWQRLYIAFIEGIGVNDPFMNFFLNPVSYLLGIDGVDIEQIVFVLSGDSPEGFDGPPLFLNPTGDGPKDRRVPPPDLSNGRDTTDRGALEGAGKTSGIEVIFLQPGRSLRVTNVWEFMPYNDADFGRKPPKGFRNQVAVCQKKLLDGPSPAAVLMAVKNVYDLFYGHCQRKRNLISLFLYTGAYPPNSQSDWVWDTCRFEALTGLTTDQQSILPMPQHGLIYTGDGFLRPQRRINNFVNCLTPSRISHTFCFQVMHHGSKWNWLRGLADQFAPKASVFSSNPNGDYYHPDKEVREDFSSYNPVCVNATQGVTFCGFVEVP